MAHHTLNARNLLCPLPVIRVQDRIATLSPGDCLAVECTDPGALNDIPAWCKINGHEVEKTEQTGRVLTLWLRVGTDPHASSPTHS